MTPEKAFLTRVFVDHCVTTKDDRRLESTLPVVTALAFRIQAAYNALVEDIQADQEDDLLRGGMLDDEEDERRAKREEARLDREFIIGEMLRMAVNLDYADEIGRRKMFQLVRAWQCHPRVLLTDEDHRRHDLSGRIARGTHGQMLGHSAQAVAQRTRSDSPCSRGHSRAKGPRRGGTNG